jgi:hypothetical protein
MKFIQDLFAPITNGEYGFNAESEKLNGRVAMVGSLLLILHYVLGII